MKKSVIKIILFIIPIIIVIALWEHELNKVSTSYSTKRHQLESGLPQIQVLVLGGSQALHGINPAYFNLKGYNVADVSQSLYYDEKITIKYLDKMTSLRFVLITFSYPVLWYQVRNNPMENWRDYFYAQYWDIQYPDLKWYDLNLHSKIMAFTPIESFKYALKHFHNHQTDDITPEGWEPYFYDGNVSDSVAIKRIEFQNGMMKNDYLDKNITYIDNLIRTLKKRNIKTILLTTPLTSHFYKYADKRKILILDSVMKAMAQTYQCRYFNYFQDGRFADTDFADPNHLNPSGATKFSKIINKEILMDSTL